MLDQPMPYQNLNLPSRIFLAPLAGITDVPFRRICQEFGAGLTFVEMLSATAINYNNKKTFHMMERHPAEEVLGVQVTGSSAKEISSAITTLNGLPYNCIDINMGCPARKLVNSGCGSALLKNPTLVSEIVQTARAATTKPLSVKIRLGYTREEVNVLEIVAILVAANIDMLTIHGRTRSESYSTPVDYSGIAEGLNLAKKLNPKLLTVGNGDIFNYNSAQQMYSLTKCDAIMVARGALGNPWIFKDILLGQRYFPTLSEWFECVNKHLTYQEEFYGDTRTSAVVMRKHLLWYAKGFPGIKELRLLFNTVESLHDARKIINNYFNNHSHILKREV